MKQQIFKLNDRVFDFRYGWGTISCIFDNNLTNYILKVTFDNVNYMTYTWDGRNTPHSPQYLSLTPYDLVSGGFSQRKSQPVIEKDTLIYVRELGEEWTMRFFSHFDKEGNLFCYNNQNTSKSETMTSSWKTWSLENPLIK
ncbi:MAG: hypothetical protein AABY22_09560 [Nanoarchaeota archaeon]